MQLTPRPNIIGFAGPKGCGKDSAAKYLLARNAAVSRQVITPFFYQINFADKVKLQCQQLFGLTVDECHNPALKDIPIDRWPFVTPRSLMQWVGGKMREYDPTIWVKAWGLTVSEGMVTSFTIKDIVLITDVRHQEEVDEIRARKGLLFYVYNPTVEARRLKGIAAGDPAWCDLSEAQCEELRKQADAEIYNNGLYKDELHDSVRQTFIQLFGDII